MYYGNNSRVRTDILLVYVRLYIEMKDTLALLLVNIYGMYETADLDFYVLYPTPC